MKIHSIYVRDFMGIKGEISLPIEESSLILIGPNGTGKTSLLTAIYSVLDSNNIPSKPIHNGEERGKVELQFKNHNQEIITATLDCKENSNSLSLKIGNFDVTKPRTYLNDLVGGNINFDPIEFAQQSKDAKGKKAQIKTILEILGLDLSSFDNAIKVFSDERLDSFRAKESMKAKVKLLASELPDDTEKYKNPIVISELIQERSLIQNDLNKFQAANVSIVSVDEQIAETTKRLEELKKKLLELNVKKADLEKIILDGQAISQKALDLDGKIQDSESFNEIHKKVADYSKIVEELAIEETTHKNLDLNVKEQNKLKLAAIEERCVALDLGCSMFFNEDNIYIDGLPMEQLNTARQIEIGVKLYMNSNPKLKIIRLNNLSLCDKKTQQSIVEIINKNDYQAFVEVVAPDAEEIEVRIEETLKL